MLREIGFMSLHRELPALALATNKKPTVNIVIFANTSKYVSADTEKSPKIFV